MEQQQYILVIDYLVVSIVEAVRNLRMQQAFTNCGIVLLTTHADRSQKFVQEAREVPLYILECDFNDEHSVQAALAPFIPQLIGVICRGDKHVQYLRKVIPILPPTVRVASSESLAAATNKQLMRAAFQALYPEITPHFTEVFDDSPASIRSVEEALQYPVIVKPANLVSSLLIQVCYNRTELEQALAKIFSRIHHIYEREERRDQPQVIVEEYLEGDFYSIDAYIMEANQVFYCPPVGYIPAKQLGIDDFFLYKRFIPTALRPEDVAAANEVVKKSLNAVGLTYSSAHVELVRTRNGWKIIELGPRLGRFRNKMYRLSYGIDHSLNDLKIHVGLAPDIPDTLEHYCAAYSIYPDHEGRLQSLENISELQKYPEVSGLKVFAEPGDECMFAKHGGHALAEFIVASKDRNRYDGIVRFVEQSVRANID